jgi:hypothetical protein
MTDEEKKRVIPARNHLHEYLVASAAMLDRDPLNLLSGPEQAELLRRWSPLTDDQKIEVYIAAVEHMREAVQGAVKVATSSNRTDGSFRRILDLVDNLEEFHGVWGPSLADVPGMVPIPEPGECDHCPRTCCTYGCCRCGDARAK